MKKILIIIVFGIAALTSCSDMLNLYPKDKVSSETFWKSKSEVEMALAGCYSHTRTSKFSSQFHPYKDGMTDMGYCWQSNYASFSDIQRGNLNPTVGGGGNGILQDLYSGMYKGVSTCVNFLQNFERTKVEIGYAEEEANLIIAEVRFLRAYFLFELVQKWGGVVIYDEIPTIDNAKIAQRSKEDCLNYIEEDLEFAKKLSSKKYSGRIVKNSVLGLNAKVALFREDWDKVATLTQAIIDSESEGHVSLATALDIPFIKRLGQTASGEVIFSAQYLAPDLIPKEGIELNVIEWSSVVPFDSFIKEHEVGDKRLEEWYYEADPQTGGFYRPSDGLFWEPQHASKTGWGLLKFFDKRNKDKYPEDFYSCKTDNDAVIMRYSEVLLMYAEAMVEKGSGTTGDAKALSAINRIRARAELAPLSGSLTREQVRKERMLELAFEGFRLFDLHRWKTAESVMNNFKSEVTGQCSFEPHFYLWPFPQSEEDVNPQLVQNPGY